MPKKVLNHCEKSFCPIARTLDILGDKWTLLILRDLLFFEKKQFREFSASPEGIPSNVLSDRLKMLEQYNIVTKQPYQTNRYEYTLTQKGQDLESVLLAITSWGKQYELPLSPEQFENWLEEMKKK